MFKVGTLLVPDCEHRRNENIMGIFFVKPWHSTEFPESPFSRLDFESETDQSWTSSPIPSPILTWFEHRDRFRVRFRVLSRETRYFESETPIFHIKPVEISPNFKSETRESFTPSPIPSLRLGYP